MKYTKIALVGIAIVAAVVAGGLFFESHQRDPVWDTRSVRVSETPMPQISAGPVPVARPDIPTVPGVVRREDLVLKSVEEALNILHKAVWEPDVVNVRSFPADSGWTGAPSVGEDMWTVLGACFSTKNPRRIYLISRPSDAVTPSQREAARKLEWSTPAAIGVDNSSGLCDISRESIDLKVDPQ